MATSYRRASGGAGVAGDRLAERADVVGVDDQRVAGRGRAPRPPPVPRSAGSPAPSADRCGRGCSSGRSSIKSRMSRKSPSAASRPCAITSTREPKRSTSSSTWLEISTHLPSLSEAVEQVDHVQPLARVEPGERFVEEQHLRVVDDRLRDLDPLAHALRVGRQAPRVGRVELDDFERVHGGAVGVVDLVQHAGEAHELAGGEALEDPLLLRHDADLARELQVAARDRGRARARCPATARSARTACAAASTCRRRSGRAAR